MRGQFGFKKLAENLDELEKLRKSFRNTIIFSIAAAVAVILLIVFLPLESVSEALIRLRYLTNCAIGVMSLGGGMVAEKKRRRYKKLYNAVIVRTVFERYFEIEEFNSDYGVPVAAIKNTRMIKMGNRYYANDFLSGKYKGIDFC